MAVWIAYFTVLDIVFLAIFFEALSVFLEQMVLRALRVFLTIEQLCLNAPVPSAPIAPNAAPRAAPVTVFATAPERLTFPFLYS